MQSLRLLADDLTGALDTSAELVGTFGPLDVSWPTASTSKLQGSFAIDSGTRELGPEQAFAIVQEQAPMLHGATVAYKKIDSLLRGPWVAELDACLRTGFWDACIIAPAFAYQGRRTHAGQQYARATDGSWNVVGDNIFDQLRGRDIEARLGHPGAELSAGVTLFDADTDEDMDRIAGIGRRFAGRLLWCGSGGLASALARGNGVDSSRRLKTPILGVFGSNHAATNAQLAMCGSVVVRNVDGRVDADQIGQRLAEGVAFVQLDAAAGSSRAEAAQHFEREIALLGRSIDPPRTLVIAGGETLKAHCLAVGAQTLKVSGRLEPGVPRSLIQGGPWSGTDVISKSGAFGPPDLWWKLLNDNELI